MQYLESKDLAKLFRVAHAMNRRHHLVMLTGFYTGARISQALRLRGEDIFRLGDRWVIKIHAAKRALERVHRLHIDTQPHFDMSPLIEMAEQKPMAQLFGGLSRQYFNLCLKKYCASVGIHTDFGHSHVFRHSAAMAIWDSTQRLGTISYFLQHRSPATSCCYLAESDGRLAQEVMDNLRLE
jgi:integrase